MQNAKCKMQNANGKCNMLSVKPFIATALFVIMLHVACCMSHALCQMHAYVDRWDMWTNFCFHVYAQMSLFMDVNVNDFFLTQFLTPGPSPVSQPIIELVPS